MKIKESQLREIITEVVKTCLMEIEATTLMKGINASQNRGKNNSEVTKQQLNKIVNQYMKKYINSSIPFKLQFERDKVKIIYFEIINFSIDIHDSYYFLTLNLTNPHESDEAQIFIVITPHTPLTSNMNFKYKNRDFGSLFRDNTPSEWGYNDDENLKAETNKEGAQLLRSIAMQINNIITQTQGHNYEPHDMGKKLYNYNMGDF